MATALQPDFETTLLSKLTRRLVPFLFLLYIVAYLDRINVGFAALQMQGQLHLSDEVYGLGAGLFFAGYFVFQLPSNLLLERVGARHWLAGLMVAWGAISSSMIFVRSPHSFYALRFLLGVAEAGFFPGVILYLKNWFPADARARTVAWFMTAAPLSGVVGGPISGALLGLRHSGLAGWQWMFLMEGVPAMLLGGLAAYYLTDRPDQATWLSDEQRNWLLATLRREHDETAAVTHTNVWAAFTHPGIWLLVVVYYGLATVSYGISLWLPNLIRSLSGVSDFVIGLLSTIPYIAAAISMVLVGVHSDRTGERRWHTAVPAFAGAAGLVLAAQSTSLVPMVAGLTVAVLGVFSMLGPFWTMPANLLTGTAAAAAIALINSVGNLGGFFGPYIIGLVRTHTGSFKEGLLVIGATLAVGGAIALLVRLRGEAQVRDHAADTV
ncbi:MAG TPA: MFS transporter [Terriglobales bacterium]|jgi:MFS transporter, ACS family, tartrate transporter|nr:MFS transporter [Terriglobales bacterium]